MTDLCINATVEAKKSYRYYNKFLWPERYAECVPVETALEMLKKEASV